MFGRRRRYRRRYPRTIAKRAKVAFSLAKRALHRSKKELKFFDEDAVLNGINATTSSDIVGIFYPIQGDTVSTRDGDKVRVRSVDIQGSVIFDKDGASGVAWCGIIEQLTDVVPTAFSDVFKTAPFNTVVPFPRPLLGQGVNTGKFRILASRRFSYKPQGTAALFGNEEHPFHIRLKWPKGHIVKFISNTGTQASCGAGSIWFACNSDFTFAGAAFPEIYATVRTRYTDY